MSKIWDSLRRLSGTANATGMPNVPADKVDAMVDAIEGTVEATAERTLDDDGSKQFEQPEFEAAVQQFCQKYVPDVGPTPASASAASVATLPAAPTAAPVSCPVCKSQLDESGLFLNAYRCNNKGCSLYQHYISYNTFGDGKWYKMPLSMLKERPEAKKLGFVNTQPKQQSPVQQPLLPFGHKKLSRKEKRRLKRQQQQAEAGRFNYGYLDDGGYGWPDDDDVAPEVAEAADLCEKLEAKNSIFTPIGGRRNRTANGCERPSKPNGKASKSELTAATADGVFRIVSDVVTDCPVAEVPRVRLPMGMVVEWFRLAKQFNVEWLAYLRGYRNVETGEYVLTGMYFPPQTATGGHVDVDDSFTPRKGTIGAVHSHVSMGVFWSHEDMRHHNWPVEVVVNARCEYKCSVGFKLDCRRSARGDSKLLVVGKQVWESSAYKLHAAFSRGEELAKAAQAQAAATASPAKAPLFTPLAQPAQPAQPAAGTLGAAARSVFMYGFTSPEAHAAYILNLRGNKDSALAGAKYQEESFLDGMQKEYWKSVREALERM